MDEEYPRSIRTNQKAYVRFLNISPRSVEIIWLNFDGIGVPYRELDCKQYVDINTYFKHYWIIYDSKTRDRMNIFSGPSRYPKAIFTPDKYESHEVDKRKWVFITLPVFSLKELCFQKLRTLKMNSRKLKDINLPNYLKEEFDEYLENPNILRAAVERKLTATDS